MSRCICCYDNSLLKEYDCCTFNSHGFFYLVDLRLTNNEIYLCPKCSKVLKASKDTSDDMNAFLRDVALCASYKDEVEREAKEVLNEILYWGMRSLLTDENEYEVLKKAKKEIIRCDMLIKKYIKNINYLLKKVETELAIFALKATASEYFYLSGVELVELLGIKQNIINKYRKRKDIKGYGKMYKKDEIQEILELATEGIY